MLGICPRRLEFEDRQSRVENTTIRIILGAAALLSFVATYQSDFGIVGSTVIFFMTFLPVVFFIGLPIFLFLPNVIAFVNGDRWLRRRVTDYLSAKADWEYHSLTTGEGFWKQLRGRELEQATGRLFREGGWSVSTTAITGDGGIDLILCKDRREVWCQCKGYAKPVSVSAVREIAGVCSASHAVPMLIVVNGLTRPAHAEAAKFAVTVWDSRELASFARGDLSMP